MYLHNHHIKFFLIILVGFLYDGVYRMKLYYIFLSMILWATCYVYGGEDLTPDDLTIMLDELNKNKEEWKEWIFSVRHHVSELADRIQEDNSINKKELGYLKDQINRAREKGIARQMSIRCSPNLLSKILDHANAIKELRSSKNKEKHVAFADDERPENAE